MPGTSQGRRRRSRSDEALLSPGFDAGRVGTCRAAPSLGGDVPARRRAAPRGWEEPPEPVGSFGLRMVEGSGPPEPQNRQKMKPRPFHTPKSEEGESPRPHQAKTKGSKTNHHHKLNINGMKITESPRKRAAAARGEQQICRRIPARGQGFVKKTWKKGNAAAMPPLSPSSKCCSSLTALIDPK